MSTLRIVVKSFIGDQVHCLLFKDNTLQCTVFVHARQLAPFCRVVDGEVIAVGRADRTRLRYIDAGITALLLRDIDAEQRQQIARQI